jgi:Lipocalin-like domain
VGTDQVKPAPVSAGSAAARIVGVWRLVSLTTDGKVNPLRGKKPTGYIFYTASGEMGAVIQPDRPPIPMAGSEPSPQEAQAALKGYTAYFGTYTVDEGAGIVIHHRKGNVQPGFEADVRRHYRFESDDRLVLGGVGTKNENVWERIG